MLFLEDSFENLPAPFETPYAYIRRFEQIPYKHYYDSVRQMKKRGIVEVYRKNQKKFIKLTHKGQLELLLRGIKADREQKWDGKWRIVMFDIPEASRSKRDLIRHLLKKQGFVRFQNSVFIGPYQLKRNVIQYLKVSHLIHYIRILRVDEVDDDRELLRRFKLKPSKR